MLASRRRSSDFLRLIRACYLAPRLCSYDGYKKACAKKNVQPRYYWDAAKNGYYFWFDGCFKFETEWQMKGECE